MMTIEDTQEDKEMMDEGDAAEAEELVDSQMEIGVNSHPRKPLQGGGGKTLSEGDDDMYDDDQYDDGMDDSD